MKKQYNRTKKALTKSAAYIGGFSVIAAIILGIISAYTTILSGFPTILVLAGVAVGLFNIKGKESMQFAVFVLVILVAAMSMAYLPNLLGVTAILAQVMKHIALVIIPASLVVAVINIVKLSK